MEKDDFRLVCLMEELAEAAQRASKQLRFGRDEVQPGQPFPNHARLREELLDVLVVIRDLSRHSQIEEIDLAHVLRHEQFKLPKMQKMLELSRKQGRLSVSEKPVETNGCRLCEAGISKTNGKHAGPGGAWVTCTAMNETTQPRPGSFRCPHGYDTRYTNCMRCLDPAFDAAKGPPSSEGERR